MVEINLLVMISLYVLSFAIRGHEIHVQQGGAAVQVEFPAGDAVQAEIGSFRIGISRRGDAEDDVVQTYFAAQNLCVEAEMNGLGICYLGTTIYTAGMIAEILELPKGVIPVTTIVLGYPDESPELTDRLPLEAVVHYEKYTDYTAAEIDELWAEREESELTKRLLEENGLPNLAQIFTQRRYVREDNLSISNSYFALLKEKGFFNN